MNEQLARHERPLFMCITNIPNTYRLHEFEYLWRELDRRGVAFEVIFMAETEPGRHWLYHPGDWSFRSDIARGIHPRWKRFVFHFNPGILRRLLQRRPTWVLVGGGWTIPTGVLVTESIRALLPKTVLLFWVEATLGYTKYSRVGGLRSVKQGVLSRYDGFVVPGKSSVDYVRELFGAQLQPTVRLPNFVDEDDYCVRVMNLRKQREDLRRNLGLNEAPVFLLPARLIPEKGLMPFFNVIANLPREQFSLLLAGDGPMETELSAFTKEHGLSQVKMLGHQELPRLLELYALSDALVLPSPREPYGFVAVEALWAGLPLVLSREIGALPEVLVDGENGWCFNPFDQADAAQAMEAALAAGPSRLAKMGLKSQQIARERFASEPSAAAFVKELMGKFPSRY